MGSLVFSREKLGAEIFVTGVKRPEDPLFFKILGQDQKLASHPLSVQIKLKAGRGRRTNAIRLDETEFGVYWSDGRFSFRGRVLETGKYHLN